MLEISRTDMSLPQRTSAPPSVCCLAQQQASSLSSGRREPSGHVLRASAPPYTGGIAGLPPARHYEPVGDATPASSSLQADVAGRSTAQPLRRPPRGVRAIGAGVDASSEDGTSTAHRREQEEDPLVEEKLGKTPSDRRATPPMANGDDSRTTSYAATRTSLQPRISAWDRCKTARAIAAQWMTTLMDQPPAAERIQEYLQQQQQQQDGRSPVTANAPCPDSGDATSTTSAVERPTHPSSFVEAVRSGNSKSKTSCSMVHARPTSASTTGPSTPSLRPSAAVDEAKPRGGLSTTAAVLDTNPRSSTPVPGDVGYQNVVLLPEDTSTIPTLLHELREIATSCSSVDHSEKPIACSSGGQRRGNGRNRLRPTAAAPPAHDADDMEQQWNTVRSHLDAVRGLIINSHEFSQALDEALGMDWRHDAPSTVDEELPSGSLQQASPSSLEKAADAEEVGELKDSAKDRKADGNHSVGSSSSLNLNAAPFYISNSTYDAADAAYYNPSPNLISLLDRGSSSNNAAFPSAPPNPVGISPTESYGSLNPYSPSQPVVPESTLGNNNASVTPPGALGSTTSGGPKSPILPYNLESRESMLRRRSAAPNAFYASASQGGGVHFLSGSPHQSYNSGSSYMSPVMAHPHSGHHLPISPLLTYASPVQLPRCMYDFLLVLDFEATCDEQVPTDYLYEIIEFPVVLVDVRLQRVVSEFHSYVRPRHKTQLSEFCHALTGIEQSDVDEALPLEEVLKQFERWYNNTVPPNSRVVFATDGPTDLRKFMYVHSVVRQGIKFPALFYQFIDVKQVFASFFDCPSGKIQAMLEVLHSPFTGRLHSGIDDARNIATIVIRLLQYGCTMQEVPLCVVHPSTPPTSVQGKPPRSGGAYTGSNGSLTPLTGLSQLPPSTTSLLGNPNHSHDGAVGEASMSTTCLPPSVTSLGNN